MGTLDRNPYQAMKFFVQTLIMNSSMINNKTLFSSIESYSMDILGFFIIVHSFVSF